MGGRGHGARYSAGILHAASGGRGVGLISNLLCPVVFVKLIVLGCYAFGARHFVRLLRNPEQARRVMLTGIIFVTFGVLMIWSALTATQGAAM